MSFLAPRIAPGISTAMARVAERFYFFSILVVGCTIYLQPAHIIQTAYLIALGALTVGTIVALHLFPWDKYEPRVFTLSYLFSSCFLLVLLVLFTGGFQSSYGILFFLIILFSFFYNLGEMLSITAVVTLFYLVPFLYDRPQPQHIALSVVTILFFFVGTYILFGVTRFVLRKNHALEDLNSDLVELYSITSALFRDMEAEGNVSSLSERLKDNLPSTYCVVLVLDDKLNLTTRIACPVRTLTWEPSIGATYPADKLMQVRSVLETRQPTLLRPDIEKVDNDLSLLLTRDTQSVLIVPIRVAAENVGVIIFGEERRWERTPFTNEKIQLAVAIGRQVAIALNMLWCYERLSEARRAVEVSHDNIIKAERLATLGEVTRAVEHEINNPLNVIVNWAEVFREDETIDPDVRKKFQIIFDMAMRIGNVVKRMSSMKDSKSVEFLKGQKMTDIPE